jgi:hypothetical protein
VRAVAVFGVPAAICAAWTVLAGKDVNWDLLNYHYYLGYELLGRRLDQDFFAASAQSYLNPVGYLPFYLMVSAGWHSVLASVALAALHGLALTFLFLIARALFADLPPRERLEFSLLGTALGAASGVLWPMVGSSFLDPLLAPAILAGLLLLIEGRRPGIAGALFGAAAALKYSNAIFVLAALPLGFTPGARLRGAAKFVLGAGLAIAALAGPWFAALWREFGNPVFPLMNAWFASPDWPAVNMVNERFGPRALGEALGFPFRMAALDRHLYSETFAPDLRFAALVAALAAVPFVRPNGLRRADWRFFAFLAAALLLWLGTSANARYGLPVLLLAGLALARLGERLLSQKAARIALATLLALQVAICIVASPTRWFIAEPWSARWLPYEAPERARREPALYLSVEVLPMAVVAPFLHPGSSFVNFAGQHSLPSDAPRLKALLDRHRGQVRALGARLALGDAVTLKAYDDALRRLGYRVDPSDCFVIAWRPEQDGLARLMNTFSVASAQAEPLSVGTCALVAQPRNPAHVEAERRMSAVFDRIEKLCPALLRGQTAVTEPFGGGWLRHYNGLDARLEAFGGAVIWHRYRSATVLELGRVNDWERTGAPLPAACRAG